MLQRETGMDTGYRPSIAAGIRPMYLRARDRGYSRGYGWHAEVRKILVIQTVSVCYSTPAGGARPLVVYSDEIRDDLYRRNKLIITHESGRAWCPTPIATSTETFFISPAQLRFQITPSRYTYGNSPSIARSRTALDVPVDLPAKA